MKEENKNLIPTFPQVLEDFVKDLLSNVHTSMPGVVVSYNPSTKMANIQPALKKDVAGNLVELPILQNVPVEFPQAANCIISWPLNPGDTGEIRFQERSIDRWKNQGGVIDPVDKRDHHFFDATFYPGLSSAKNPGLAADGTAILIQNGTMSVKVYPNGQISLSNGTYELINLLIEALTAINDATPGTPATAYITQLQTFKVT